MVAEIVALLMFVGPDIKEHRIQIDPKTGKRVAPSNKGIYEFFRTKNVPSAPDEDSSSSETELNPLPDDIF